MKIIALKGHGGSGKTSSLIELYNLLMNSSDYSEALPKQNIRNAGDFCSKFINNITKKEIAIYSEGDSPESVEQAIQKFDTLTEKDVLILACRTKGRVLKVLEPYNPIYIKKSITYYDSDAQIYVNKSDAKIILKQII
ncbi:hypothetical protein [Vagococcus fluvialis]|uniref:hypothetical protein n=1 Tax=Vagococcus fluvialis TaxID=2738 RepID=UPI003B5C2343